MNTPHSGRVNGTKVELDESVVRSFFDRRGATADPQKIYTSVLYQDSSPQLAAQRDAFEKVKIEPLLALDSTCRVLDVGCGVGRWADEIHPTVKAYVGVDASANMIEVARQRRLEPHVSFFALPAEELGKLPDMEAFDRVIIAGLLIYMNDNQVYRFLEALTGRVGEFCKIYLREPVAMRERLTLQGYWSKELSAEYNAIYRTRHEYHDILRVLEKAGFRIPPMIPLYDEEPGLNNRVETKQHFTIMERGR